MKINLSAMGDPNNPKTWSRTPLNMLTVLKKTNSIADAFSSCSDTVFFKILLKIIKVYYNTKAGEEKVKLIRFFNSDKVITRTKISATNHTLHLGTMALPLRRMPKDQFHYLFIDATWNVWSSGSTGNMYSNRIKQAIEKVEKEAYHQVKHIFSISEYVKKDLITHYNVNESQITVVGTGTGIIKPFYGKKDYNNGKILFAAKGRFADKGGDLVIEAFKKALEKKPGLHLSIVGQNEYTGNIHHSNISTYGFISEEELQHLFNTHSLFLMPALNEPWGLVYIEAMLCKMPIVGLNRNSFPELSGYGKFGKGVDKADTLLLSEVIINLISEPQLMEKMGAEAQKFCLEEFTWEETVRKIMDKIGLFNNVPL